MLESCLHSTIYCAVLVSPYLPLLDYSTVFVDGVLVKGIINSARHRSMLYMAPKVKQRKP